MAQELGGELAVGLALGRPHDSADEEAGELAACLVVAAAELLPLVGVGGDDLVDDLLQRARVHRFEATLLGDLARRPPGVDHLGQHLLGLRGGQLARRLHAHQLGHAVRIEVGGAFDGEVVLDVGEETTGVGARCDRLKRQVVEAALDGDRHRGHGRLDGSRSSERRTARRGQRGQGGVDAHDPVVVWRKRHKVGLGEVAVVLGLLLRAQRAGAAGRLVPVPGLLAHALARFQQLDLPPDLVVDGPPK